jgi:NAD+ kinase
VSRSVTVLTHTRPQQVADALEILVAAARKHGVTLRFDEEETRKNAVAEGDGIILDAPLSDDVDLCVVLGGDGTILTALRACAVNRAPVFAFNYGAIGFLSTVERDDLDTGLERAFAGDFELLPMPALELDMGDGRRIGVNDVSFHRRANSRVATIEYAVAGEQLGRVRCDGLVAATPVGSTGYNLANGGPVLAWGVEGFVVSFIAPHTLTARALVVAPDDVLTVLNASERDAVDVTTDGRPVGQLDPGEHVDLRFSDDQVVLAQLDGATFYHRFREKFGRLAY